MVGAILAYLGAMAGAGLGFYFGKQAKEDKSSEVIDAYNRGFNNGLNAAQGLHVPTETAPEVYVPTPEEFVELYKAQQAAEEAETYAGYQERGGDY